MTTEAGIKALLPKTYAAFFGRFGRLRPIQLQAVPRIVAGDSVLVTAPTASGKTEAVVAPMVERALALGAARAGGVLVLIVTPTRALANDLHRRLLGPLGQVGVSVGVKTSDQPKATKTPLPRVLVTTPESLDSLLVRRPADLREVSACAVDEVHLLDGTPRGDQTACLMERLLRLVPQVQRCAASATLPDGQATAHRYLGSSAVHVGGVGDQPEAVGAHRGIEARTVEARSPDQVVDYLRRRALAPDRPKLLVFTNRRRDAETLASLLRRDPQLAERVLIHHGSLSRGERLNAEKRLMDSPGAICLATSTLEVGIDVGSVDEAVLFGPPANVSALLQRVGRANRRSSTARLSCLYEDEFQRRRFEHLLSLARAGRLLEETVPFRPSIVAQQALSLVFQNPERWVSAAVLHQRLPAWAEISEAECRVVLLRLVEQTYLRALGTGRFGPEERAEQLLQRGNLHVNIESQRSVEVVDDLTGRVLGQVPQHLVRSGRAGVWTTTSLALGGKSRKIERVRGEQVFVTESGDAVSTAFDATGRPRYGFQLAQDLARFLGVPAGVMWVVPDGSGVVLWHFLGTVWGQVLAQLCRQRGWTKRRGGTAFELALEVQPGSDWGSREGLKAELGRALERSAKSIARLLEPGPFLGAVPDDLLERWLVRAVNPDALASQLAGVRLEVVPRVSFEDKQ